MVHWLITASPGEIMAALGIVWALCYVFVSIVEGSEPQP